jgi:hypothetical protein
VYGIVDCIESCWEVEFVKMLCAKYLMECIVEREHAFLMILRDLHQWCLLLYLATLGQFLCQMKFPIREKNKKL